MADAIASSGESKHLLEDIECQVVVVDNGPYWHLGITNNIDQIEIEQLVTINR